MLFRSRLIDEYGGRLTAAAVSLCGNETDAKDLVWETVDIAVRQIRAYRGEAAVFEWLYGIMQNLYRQRIPPHTALEGSIGLGRSHVLPPFVREACVKAKRLSVRTEGRRVP